jgi:hypothetical protein
VGYTCETAHHFFQHTVLPRVDRFKKGIAEAVAAAGSSGKPVDAAIVAGTFPFSSFFSDAPGGLEALFPGTSFDSDLEAAEGCFRHLNNMLEELNRCALWWLCGELWTVAVSALGPRGGGGATRLERPSVSRIHVCFHCA